jgi:GT2 family glycosyltransferase
VGISYLLTQRCDYVLLLNNDTTVQADFLDKLVEVGEHSKLVGTVGPKIYYSDKNQLVSEGGKIDFEKGPFLNVNQNKTDNHVFKKPVERDYLSGCCLLVKKQIFDSVGYLDDKFFCYVEDVDFGFRVKLGGYKNLYVPQSVIFHKTSKSSGGEINAFKEFYKSRNFVLFARKHYTNLHLWKFIKSALRNRIHDSKMAILNKKYAIPVSIV